MESLIPDVFTFTPIEQWEIVEVTFLASNTFQRVSTTLRPANPRRVRYLVIRASAACAVSDNLADPGYLAMPWAAGSLVLKGSTASTVELLLFIPRDPTLPR